MDPRRAPDPLLLARFLSGECTQLETLAVQAWLREDPSHEEELHRLALAWARPREELETRPGSDTDAFWGKVRARIEPPAPAVERSRSQVVMRRFETPRRSWLLPSAAAALLLAVTGSYLLRDRRPEAVAVEPAPMREVSTGAGQRAEVKLGDGSAVLLGVQSRLRFPAVLGSGSRELHLEGEAHFVVTHDSTRPFIVYAAGTKTVDLGTAFVVRAYPEDRGVRVVVTEGRVALGADTTRQIPTTEIAAGERGWLPRGASVPSVRAVDTAAYLGWMRGRIVFDNTPLADVIVELERWHDVEITLGDPSLAREEFTASFVAESLQETLRTLTTALQVRAERRGATVVLHRRA